MLKPQLLRIGFLVTLLSLSACTTLSQQVESGDTGLVIWGLEVQSRARDGLAPAFLVGRGTAETYYLWPALMAAEPGKARYNHFDNLIKSITLKQVAEFRKDDDTTRVHWFAHPVDPGEFYVPYITEDARLGLVGRDRYEFRFAQRMRDEREGNVYEVSADTPRIRVERGEIVYIGTFRAQIEINPNSLTNTDVADVVISRSQRTSDGMAIATTLNLDPQRLKIVDIFRDKPKARSELLKPFNERSSSP